MKQLILLLTLFINPLLAFQTYRAAVLEHHPLIGDTAEATILKNLDSYRHHAKEAKTRNADIIVFPEYGLTTLDARDNLTQYAIPVNDNNKVVKKLRTIASDYQIYLVVNLFEETQWFKVYNTNLVFDRHGNIILKYRKIHPINEGDVSPGSRNQNLQFTTDFGVTFGIFTCFDIKWENPARRVLETGYVTDIVYPTAWSASMPFNMPMSIQHGYSVANGVNFLAASYNDPSNGLGGSSIYIADGQIADSYVSDIPGSKLLVQDVPKIYQKENKTKCATNNISVWETNTDFEKNNSVDNFYLFDDYTDKTLYKYQNLNLSEQFSFHELCVSEFCCTFDISITEDSSRSDVYKLIAYNHRLRVDENKFYMRVCSILLCEDENVESCGKRLNSSVKFEKITIKGRLDRDEWRHFMPVALTYYFQPIVDAMYCVLHEAEHSVVELTTSKPLQDILVFGIKGTVMSRSPVCNFATFLMMILTIVDFSIV